MRHLVNKHITEEQRQKIEKYIDTYISQEAKSFSVNDLFESIQGIIPLSSDSEIQKSIKKSIQTYLNHLASNNVSFKLNKSNFCALTDKKIKSGEVFSSGNKFFVKENESNRNYYVGTFNYPYKLFEGDEVWFYFNGGDPDEIYGNDVVADKICVQLKKRTEKLIICRVSRDRNGDLYCVPENSTKYPGLIIDVVNLEPTMADAELVAVIAAAIAAYEGSASTDGFTVRSIRKVNSKWKNNR